MRVTPRRKKCETLKTSATVVAFSLDEIIAEVAAHFGVSMHDILGPSRKASVVAARHTAMQRVGAQTTLSLPAIGRLFGRNHTTVLHALHKPEEWKIGDGRYHGSLNRKSVPSPYKPRNEARNSAIIERRKSGASLGKIAVEFGLTSASVYKICRDIPKPLRRPSVWGFCRDIPKPLRRPRPPKPPKPPKNVERNAEIIRLREAGIALRVIGQKFGLSYEMVRQINIRQSGADCRRTDPLGNYPQRHSQRCSSI